MNDQCLRVLLIEDNPGDARLIREMLDEARLGAFDLQCAERLSAGLQLLTGEEIDVVLLDLGLPESQGLDSFAQVHAQAPDVPIVVLTGLEDEELALQAVEAGAQDYLVKGHVESNPLARALRYAIERKRTEKALRESEARYRDLYGEAERLREFNAGMLQTMGEGVVLEDPDGVIAFVNRRVQALLGYSGQELLGQHYSILVPEDERARVAAQTARRPQGVPSTYETRLLAKDGREIPVLVSATPFEEDGEFAGTLATLTDIAERVRAEEDLRESEKRFHTLAKASPVGIFRTDAEGHCCYVNEHWCEIAGLSPEEARGTGWEQALHPGDRERVASEWYEAARASALFRSEYRFQRPDGATTWVFGQAAAEKRDSGEVAGFIGTITDITERVQAEEELRQYAERLRVLHAIDGAILAAWSSEEIARASLRHVRRLVPCVGAGVMLLDAEAREATLLALEADEEVETRTGARFPVGQILDTEMLRQGKVHVVSVGTGLVPAPQPKAVADVLRAVGARSYVAAPLIAHGGLIGCLALGTETPSGFRPEHVDIAREVADQLAVGLHQARLRAALEAEERRLKALVEHLPEGIVQLDSQRRILFSNPAARRHISILADAATGDVLTHLDGYALEELLPPPPEGLWHELEIVGPPRRVLEVLAQPLSEASMEGWVLLIRNVTEAREIQQRVQHQERLAAVGQLAGGIAHDFNNLLTTIMLYAHKPLNRPDLPSDVKEALETILSESQGAADLVQQIMDFSRRSPIEVHPMDLKPFVKEVARVLERTIPESVRVHLETGPGQHVIKADPTRIQQVLMNLALNARDAMPDGGELRIGLSRTRAAPIAGADTGLVSDCTSGPPSAAGGEWVCLAISDTGTGIPPDVLPHIYEPFFTTKPRGEGTGLGLAQVYGIVKQHGGHIDVETKEGQGTAFRVYLPLHRPKVKQAPSEEATLPPPEGRGETILLVEDEQRIRTMLQQLLESLGYRVLSAANGQEALDLYAAIDGVDLLLTDVVMPEMGGKQLIQDLRARGVNPMKALAITGHLVQQDVNALKKAGFCEVVLKPFDIRMLATAVRRTLDAG